MSIQAGVHITPSAPSMSMGWAATLMAHPLTHHAFCPTTDPLDDDCPSPAPAPTKVSYQNLSYNIGHTQYRCHIIDSDVATKQQTMNSSGEVLSEVWINMYIDHPDKRDLSYWWVFTTPNAGYIPMAPISIWKLQVRVDGRFRLDDCTLHPQMYVWGFEYIFCIPKHDESWRMLWWTPTLADCSIVQNGPFSITICVLKPKLLQGYKGLHNKYIGLIGRRANRSLLTGLFVSVSQQTLIHQHDVQRDPSGNCGVPASSTQYTCMDWFRWCLPAPSVLIWMNTFHP